MKVMVIPIVVGVFGTVPKGFEYKLEEEEIIGRIETLQTWQSLGCSENFLRHAEVCCQ